MKDFEEYLKKGIAKKCSIDKPRVTFLINEAEKSFNGLKKRLDLMGIEEDNANSIVKDCHDVIMELIRAKLLLNGYNCAGLSAHEAEVSYLKKCGFSDSEVLFVNDLRYFRNSVTYYGKILDVSYAQKVADFTKKIYPKLRKMVE